METDNTNFELPQQFKKLDHLRFQVYTITSIQVPWFLSKV